MHFRTREGPLPRIADSGLSRSERMPGRLSNHSTPRPCPAQSVPRESLGPPDAKIYRLGERPLFELFRELDAGAPLIPCLEAYARLERYAGFIAANDGDRLPQPRLVPGRRA